MAQRQRKKIENKTCAHTLNAKTQMITWTARDISEQDNVYRMAV